MVGACPYPVPQGSQVLLRHTALALRDRGHIVHLVVYGYGAGPEDPGLRVHRCLRIPGMRRTEAGPSFAKPLADAALVQTLRRVIREENIQLVHAHNYEGLMVALAARRRPVVYHAHNAMVDELPHFIPCSRPFGQWLDRTFPHRADRVIAPHRRLAVYLAECGCDTARISVAPPALEVGAFEASTVTSERPAVLYTGNLDRYQNLDLLLAAMTQVRKAALQTRLIIATAQPAMIPEAEIVLVPDFDSLRRILAEDCVVVCPRVSWSGYPIKLLNAMAAGRAVVACASAAPPVVHESNGILVPDNDAAAMADAILRLIRDTALRFTLGRNARQTILAEHAPEKIASAIEAIYDGLLGHRVP
jgi:glycosyltransferase involved in cell wall biosynthesis